MTIAFDKSASQKQQDDARLAELNRHGAALLSEFEGNFNMPYRLTLVARNPARDSGSLDVIITDDDGSAIAETVLRRMPDTAGSDERTGMFLADRLIAIGAFRYALGRMTYMPSHVADWLLANRAKLSKADRELVVREIDEAADLRRLGMDCDVRTWSRLRDAFAPSHDALAGPEVDHTSASPDTPAQPPDRSTSPRLPEAVEAAIGAVVTAAALAADRDEPSVAAVVAKLRDLLLPRLLPAEPTSAVQQVLGLPNFRAGPIAHLFRAAGADIPPKAEEEQAHVLFRFLPLALEHGDGWRAEANRLIDAAQASVQARKAEGSAAQ